MPLSTGCAQLDSMLRGGYPEHRSILVVGGPGVGKSTLAMQFVQEGLQQGEECLYISTEQTSEELKSAFETFDFDLEHPNLTITSIHATPARETFQESSTGLTIQTLQGDANSTEPFHYPFERDFLLEYLQDFGPCDRVVLDSASALSVISEDDDRYRRVLLDIIRLFTDRFEATTLFTAEESPFTPGSSSSIGSSDLLQFTTSGVIRLFWKEIEGSRRRFLQIVKMRGIDHDTRNYEVGFSSNGIFLTPKDRTTTLGITDDAVIPTTVEGLDDLCGGLIRGHSVLLEYDGRALVDNIVAHVVHSALTEDMSVWFFPSPIMQPDRLHSLMPGDWDIEQLLERNQLFVLDGFGAWTDYHSHSNVFASPTGILGALFRKSSTVSIFLMKQVARKVGRTRMEGPMMGVVYTEAFLRWLSSSQVKEVYYWAREELAQDHDTGFWIHNPDTMDPQLAEFFHSDAVQVLRTSMQPSGIQYVTMQKTPIGRPGQSGVIDLKDDQLFVTQT